MVRTVFKVLLADIILVAAVFWVFGDLQWRTAFAASAHSPATWGAPYSSYAFLTQFFTIVRNGVSLTSPPTLDWVQLIVVVLVVINGWLAYHVFRARSVRSLA